MVYDMPIINKIALNGDSSYSKTGNRMGSDLKDRAGNYRNFIRDNILGLIERGETYSCWIAIPSSLDPTKYIPRDLVVTQIQHGLIYGLMAYFPDTKNQTLAEADIFYPLNWSRPLSDQSDDNHPDLQTKRLINTEDPIHCDFRITKIFPQSLELVERPNLDDPFSWVNMKISCYRVIQVPL